MNLAIRPRAPWEALDVGCLLAQRHYPELLRLWVAITLPWLALLALLAPPWVILLLFWWAKPAYDRALLLVLGRGVFGERLSLRQSLRLLPGLWWQSGLLWGLTLGRFSLTRSYDLPLRVLEGVRGQAYRARWRLLHNNGDGTATWLTLLAVHLEALLVLALLVLLLWLLPENVALDFEDFFTEETETTADYVYLIPTYLGMTLMEPFYVAAGFSLYLNRRTHLEGWDLELAFRRMAVRLGQFLLLAGLGLSLAIQPRPAVALEARVLAPEAECQPRPASPHAVEQALTEVLAAPEFVACRSERRWDWLAPKNRAVQSRANTPPLLWDNLGRMLAAAMEWVLWGMLGVALVALGLYLKPWIRWLDWQSLAPRRPAPPTQLMGLDIRPEQLPADIPAAAWQLWQGGAAEAALSLLYRGALAVLVQRAVLLADSATEADCLHQVMQHQPPPVGQFFTELTQSWLLAAYAHRLPATPQVQQLCQQWPQHFAS